MAETDSFATEGSISLIAPGMFTALRQSDAPSGVLALLAGRGNLRQAWDRTDLAGAHLRIWQRSLLDVLGLDPSTIASAPLSAVGDEQQGDGYWLHAELVHLAAGLDRLTYLPLTGPASVTAAEREALAPLMSQHLQESPLRLLPGRDRWFLHSARALDLKTASPDAAAANELETVMPSGLDASVLRRVMTECQMLLHDHEVNERRQRRGLPAINSLWPWGGGVVSSRPSRSLPRMFSDNEFVRGLYRMHGLDVTGLPPTGSALSASLTGSQPVVAVVAAADSAALERDWIEPLVAALRTGRIERLDLVLDEWHIRATRGMLRRFWRKPLPATAWPQSLPKQS